MVVKVYITGISGNKEVKKRQQKALLILDSKNIKYELLDISEPNMEEAKEFMQNNSTMNGGTISDPNPRHTLPPQFFNDDEYCGDYDAFDMANEIDEMEKFLKLPEDQIPTSNVGIKFGNGELPSERKSKEASPEGESKLIENVPENEGVTKKDDEAGGENKKEKSPSPKIDESPSPQKEKSPSPQKEKSPSPLKEKSPSPKKEKSPSPKKEKSPSPKKEKSPSPKKEKSPSPKKEKSPSPAEEGTAGGDNETDDQKAENAEIDSKDKNAETAEETEKSEEA